MMKVGQGDQLGDFCKSLVRDDGGLDQNIVRS